MNVQCCSQTRQVVSIPSVGKVPMFPGPNFRTQGPKPTRNLPALDEALIYGLLRVWNIYCGHLSVQGVRRMIESIVTG